MFYSGWVSRDCPFKYECFIQAELAKYDGSEGSPGIYLALLGQVII